MLGKHRGRAALDQRYREMGYALARRELEKAYRLFTEPRDVKKTMFETDLLAILQNGISDISESEHREQVAWPTDRGSSE